MVLGGKLVGSVASQAGIQNRMSKAMQDLSIKADNQRKEREVKAENDARDFIQEKENIQRAQNLTDVHNMHYNLDSAEIESLREQRKALIKKEREILEENLAKGHGEVSEIAQDDFLATCIESKFCLIHFYHKEFEKCMIMDKFLRQLATTHKETKFCRLNAEKAPFFVKRLSIQVLPSVVCFIDGKKIDQVLGFEFNEEKVTCEKEQIKLLEERLGLIGVIKMNKDFYFKEPTTKDSSKIQKNKTEDDSDSDDDW